MSDPLIVYIAGYSRSGSTIIDILLGSHPDVCSTGEITYMLDDATNPKRSCTCGARYADCTRHGGWLTSAAGQAALQARDQLRSVENRAGLEALKAGTVPQADQAAYRDYARSLYAHLAQNSGARVILDSSKSARDAAGRPLALARLAGLNVKVLHLTRDPKAVVRTYIENGSNWVAEGHRKATALDSFRPVIGWAKANGIAQGLQADFGQDYMHLRYEDLMADPQTQLDRIGQFVGVDFSAQLAAAQAGQAFLADHNVGGNRNRLEPQVIRLKEQKPVSLPLAHNLAYRTLAAGTARKLGYS